MNRKQLKWIAGLLGLAVLLYLPSALRDDEGRGTVASADGFRFELVDPVTRVDILTLESGDTIRLERTPEGWTVDGYVADSAKVAQLLETIPSLASGDLVARNPSNHGALGVSDSTGRRVEVYTQAGGPLAFHLGNRDLAADGYFVRMPRSDPVFRLQSPAAGYLSRDRDGWRRRIIAEVDTGRVREAILKRGAREAVLRRTEAGWRLGRSAADSATVSRMLQLLAALNATGFATDEEAATSDFAAPDAELDVFAEAEGDVTGRRLVLSLRLIEDEEDASWLVRPADGSEVYRLSAFTVGRLLPTEFLPAEP